MAKNRMINTRIWNDTWFDSLDQIEKLVFIYLLTNTYTTICGCYEIPIKNIAVDCGLDPKVITEVLNRFSEQGKVHYIEGWIVLPNFQRHQSTNPSVDKGIERELELVPDVVKQGLEDNFTHPVPSLSQPVTPNLTKPNLTKPNLTKPNATRAVSLKSKKFSKPSLQEVKDLIEVRGYNVDPESFVAFYESNGWKVGKNPMKSWEACLVTWNNRSNNKNNNVRKISVLK